MRLGWPNYEYPKDFAETGDISSVRGRDGGYTYKDYVGWAEGVLDPGERLMTPEEWILDDFGWHLVLEEEKRQIASYWPEFMKLDGINIVFSINTLRHEPPDAGWRVYLGLVLRGIPDKSARLKELKDFYHHWHEMISK